MDKEELRRKLGKGGKPMSVKYSQQTVPNLEWCWPLTVVLEFEIVVLEEQN